MFQRSKCLKKPEKSKKASFPAGQASSPHSNHITGTRNNGTVSFEAANENFSNQKIPSGKTIVFNDGGSANYGISKYLVDELVYLLATAVIEVDCNKDTTKP